MYILLVLWYYFLVSNTTYFTEAEIDDIIAECDEKVKGHKRYPTRKKYTVYVDDGVFEIGQRSRLRKFLGECIRPKNIRIFRNIDKGATIYLD